MELLLPEAAAHHGVAVLVNAIDEVLATFQEKSLNPIYVLTRTLLTPMHPLLRNVEGLGSGLVPHAHFLDCESSA